MTKPIRSGILQFLNNALGLTGEGAQTTELDDGFISQVLPIERIAAYGQAFGANAGMLTSILDTVHVAAGDITETMDPYDPGTRVLQFGAVNFDEIDMWYLGTIVRFISSTQTVDECQLAISGAVPLQGMSEGVAAVVDMVLHRWSGSPAANVGFGLMLPALGNLQLFQASPFGPFLWPRSQVISVASQTTGAGATTIRFATLWAMTNRALKPSAI